MAWFTIHHSACLDFRGGNHVRANYLAGLAQGQTPKSILSLMPRWCLFPTLCIWLCKIIVEVVAAEYGPAPGGNNTDPFCALASGVAAPNKSYELHYHDFDSASIICRLSLFFHMYADISRGIKLFAILLHFVNASLRQLTPSTNTFWFWS